VRLLLIWAPLPIEAGWSRELLRVRVQGLPVLLQGDAAAPATGVADWER
jgi:hypothetical protein